MTLSHVQHIQAEIFLEDLPTNLRPLVPQPQMRFGAQHLGRVRFILWVLGARKTKRLKLID